ncbi:hypothetical protein PHISP_06206 [Aspergillus sp. HF37]|nr:hypothetical protein PHISP_06206 [Aspergillus sp. HF37]
MTKRAMKDWLFGLKLQLETSVFAGMTFPGTVKGGLFATMDENKDFRANEGKFSRKGSQTHPVRPLVETLYRNASPFSREFRQAVNQLNCSSTSKIIYVPHIWCLIINDACGFICGGD